MVFDPANDVEQRIEEACREYVEDDSMTVFELEDRIERALTLTYTYEELLSKVETNMVYHPNVDPANAQAMIFGKEIEPGGEVSFEDEFEIDPFEVEPDPWDDDFDGFPDGDRDSETTLAQILADVKDSQMESPAWSDRKI